MRIDSLKTFVVANPEPGKGGRYFIFLKLYTACGGSGVGEVYTASFSPLVVEHMIQDIFARYIEGMDPFRIENAYRQVYSSGFSQRPDPSLMAVFSGLEMACWDIVGRALNQPVYQLLGGKVRDKLRSYTYLYPPEGVDPHAFYHDPDQSAEAALRYVEQGFTAIKFDPAGPYTAYDPHQPSQEDLIRSELFIKRLREAVGDRADLLFGTHGQFTTTGAKRMIDAIKSGRPLWFEEPVPPEMPEQMATVAAYSSVPIATGERLTTKYEFARVLSLGAASIVQPALGRVGGLLEAKKIAALAETHYAQVAPHLYAGPIAGAANIQLATCIPNFLLLEGIETWGGFYAQLLKKPIQWEAGYVIPSDEPGLGVELDEVLAEAAPYTGGNLHLQMQETELDYSKTS